MSRSMVDLIAIIVRSFGAMSRLKWTFALLLILVSV